VKYGKYVCRRKILVVAMEQEKVLQSNLYKGAHFPAGRLLITVRVCNVVHIVRGVFVSE
jgi:hypothetical protein